MRTEKLNKRKKKKGLTLMMAPLTLVKAPRNAPLLVLRAKI
jgi:hypothetical protein